MTGHNVHERAADVAAATSAACAGSTWLITTNEVLQVLASAVAIIAGLAAAWYHIKNARKL